MKYLSFSLWSSNPLYCVGAIKNAEQYKSIYDDWQMVLYYDETVPTEVIDTLRSLDVTLFNMTKSNIYGPFWRFLIADSEDCEYACFRDCDSRLSVREKLAVDEWIESKKSIHIMRDHPAHGIPFGANSRGILAGMWGIKGKLIPMENMIVNFSKGKEFKYGIDQTFLTIINSIYQNDNITHDEFFEKKPFPIKRKNYRFVGERIGTDEKPVGNDWKILMSYE